jgi:hypothetical protein
MKTTRVSKRGFKLGEDIRRLGMKAEAVRRYAEKAVRRYAEKAVRRRYAEIRADAVSG